MQRKAIVVLLVVFGFLFSGALQAHEPTWWSRHAEFQRVVSALETRGFEQEEVNRAFSDPHVAWYPNLPQLQPRESSGEDPYAKFSEEESVRRSRMFMERNPQAFEKFERNYGIPKEIGVCKLRIESNFGENAGRYQAFGVFTSLLRWSHDAGWKKFARKELMALFEVAQILGVSPLDIHSSWAGAFGLPQFLPSSFLAFGADGNHDGKIDLFNLEDSLASIGNYLLSNHRVKVRGVWRTVNWNTSPRLADYAYNRSWAYVNAGFDCAAALGWEE